MAPEILLRQDLSIYIVAGVPKSFKKRLQKFVDAESKSDGEVMLLDDEMAEWTLARVRGEKRRSHEQTPASSALWRAFRALSAARYHLQDDPIEGRIREVRDQIEALWREASPEIAAPEAEEELEEVG
jgi:ATP-dependent Clp protease ATP-binding subunit ClpA